MVAIGGDFVDPTAKGWAGHLVVVLPDFFDDLHAIFDLTITQANKPEWGIGLKPIVARVPDSFVKGEKEFNMYVNGSLVTYMAFPEDHSFETTSVWSDRPYQDRCVKTSRNG